MTDENPDATDVPNYVSPDDPGHPAFVAAVRDVRRRSLPPPPERAASAPVAAASRAPSVPVAAAVIIGGPAASADAHPIRTGAVRDDAAKEVFVYGKAQVMAVFANPDGNYTVTGYGERSHKGFGEFFLGLDAGDEYERQSRDINAAIQSITAEEGFTLGLDGARAAYRTLNGAAAKGGTSLFGRIAGMFRSAPKPKPQAAEDVSTQMLAAVSKTLFGIPDEDLIVTGPIRFSPGAPGHCPGDFAVVSASLFKPEPKPEVAGFGAYLGGLLARQTATVVARLRAAGTPPPGRLTKVLFDTIPPEEDDRLVRTLIGAMMGLLPTVDGNLIKVMNGLQENGQIPGLKRRIAALGAEPGYEQVKGVLKSAVYRAMQQDPVPEEVWRIAAHEHVISGDMPVRVKKGDKVVVSIESATRADLEKGEEGIEDVSPIFGGLKTGKGRRPVHGCPGHAMALGVIYGTVAVILQQPD